MTEYYSCAWGENNLETMLSDLNNTRYEILDWFHFA
jgi:hypothetical protein